MITFKTGDIFQSKCDVLVNPVNCVGVMGKGLAKQFKLKFPEMFDVYRKLCDYSFMRIGNLELYEELEYDHAILLFPTKEHWSHPSKLEFIEKGLDEFCKNYEFWGYQSFAFPKIGCGLGGLNWESEVKPMILEKFDLFPNCVEIEIYE